MIEDYTEKPIEESIKNVVGLDAESIQKNSEYYINVMFEHYNGKPGGKQLLLNKIRTFFMTAHSGYRYTHEQNTTLLTLAAKLGSALKLKSYAPYTKYEETGSYVWHVS